MTAAPVLTEELRNKLQSEYREHPRIVAFLVWDSPALGAVIYESFFNKADAYSTRFEMISENGFTIEQFTVIDTFKEFETEKGE